MQRYLAQVCSESRNQNQLQVKIILFLFQVFPRIQFFYCTTHLCPPPPCDESAPVVASLTSECAGCCPLLPLGCAAGCQGQLWGCAHCCQGLFSVCLGCLVWKHCCLGCDSLAPLPPEKYQCKGGVKSSWLNLWHSKRITHCCLRPFYLAGGPVLSCRPHCSAPITSLCKGRQLNVRSSTYAEFHKC